MKQCNLSEEYQFKYLQKTRVFPCGVMLSCTYRIRTKSHHAPRFSLAPFGRQTVVRCLQHITSQRANNSQATYPFERFRKKKKKKEIKCRFGMNSLYAACTDNSLTVGFKERLGTWREVSEEGENHKKWFSHAHHTALVFINPYCTSPPHLKQTLASTLQLASKSELVLLCHP